MADQENKVTHDTKAHRFSLANGTFVEYSLDKEVMDMYHTVTPPECRGKGYAGKVVRAAVDYCKDKGFKVKPTCSYVAHFMSKTKEDQALVV